MIAAAAKEIRVLAIDPTTNGFGFAVLEGAENLIDWGVREASSIDRNGRCVELVVDLIERYRPSALVLEKVGAKGSRRCPRVKEFIESLRVIAAKNKLAFREISKARVKLYFAGLGAKTKHEIATAISNLLPELAARLPRYRQPWMSEDSRMAIFDAIALALAYYETKTRRPATHPLSALGINNDVHEQESSGAGY